MAAIGIMVTLAAAFTVALGTEPAAARTKDKALHREADRNGNEPFGNAPKGPVQIFVSIDQQKLHLYSDGAHVADTSVATGVPHLPTPTGVFSVIQKQVFHRSNIYSGAPMPFMQRITWSGVALHEGENIGHPASHGCIRMPGEFAARLYKFTRIGARVIVAKGELKPVDFADPHLFVHRDIQAAALPNADAVKTAQNTDANKASDADSAAKPFDLGLRGSNANVAANIVLAASDDVKPIATDAVTTDAPSTDAAKPAEAQKPADAANASDAAKASDATKSSDAAKSSDTAKPSDAISSDTAKSDAPAAADAKAADKSTPAADTKPDAPAVTGSTTGVPVIAAPDKPARQPGRYRQGRADQENANCDFHQPQREEDLRAAGFRAGLRGSDHHRAARSAAWARMSSRRWNSSPDNATFRWNVVSMPAESAKPPSQARVCRRGRNSVL